MRADRARPPERGDARRREGTNPYNPGVGTLEQTLEVIEARLRPLEVDLAWAWWDASTHASPEADRRRAELDLARREVLADPAAFEVVREARARDVDPLVQRRVELLHDAMAPQQVPSDLRRRIVDLETEVEATFTTFRGELDGERLDDNAILEILRTSDDEVRRRGAWEASKQVGEAVAGQVRELAALRNEAARALGFRDHFALALATSELDEDRLLATLDEVDRATREQFSRWKGQLDQVLATRFGIDGADLGPWHMDDPFFQDPPVSGSVDLDSVFADSDLEALTARTFDGLGLDVRPVLARSDLYAREGKNQHAFCIDIDREGDVRVLCNVQPTERWMDTMLHEFGHAVYDRGIDRGLPWFLRAAAHALTTEGVAMLFGRIVREPEWLRTIAGLGTDEVAALTDRLATARRAALLTFARWVLVVTYFERGLYADPHGDLDTLWWDLVERHQQIRRPPGRHAPDWAAKIHLAVAPVYYQNYLYGELFASQLEARFEGLGALIDRPEVGEFFGRDVFGPGASLRWDHLVEHATGAPLSARALRSQLVG